MNKFEFWVKDGCLVDRPHRGAGQETSDRALILSDNYVKVETSEAGTRVRWSMFTPNWSSLFFVQDWLQSLGGPYWLNFFNAGWFSERYATAREASDRIAVILGKSDVRFSARVFTRNFSPSVAELPELLRQTWEGGLAPPANSVLCSVDLDKGTSQVEDVGHRSAIASIWGVSPVSFPCLTGHSYDRVVSNAYVDVVKSSRPNYSHVLAAMTQPDGETQWYGYQRIILPASTMIGRLPSVQVIGVVSPVNIPLL